MRITWPGMNTDVELIGRELFLFELKLIIFITIVIILLVFFFPVIIVASGCGFANIGMAMHGLCTGGEAIQAAGTDEAKLVVDSLQMIHQHSLILTLFATPGAEGQATSSSQGLSSLGIIQAHCKFHV